MTRWLVAGSTISPRARAEKQPGQLVGAADRELRGVVGAAVVAHEVEQGGAREAERLGAGAHGLEADAAQEDVGGQVVAGRADEGREVGDRQGRHLQVLPDARLAGDVARVAVQDARAV